jgi:hypothetical protein
MCKAEGTKHCGECKDALYCSAECQISDRSVHKLLCKEFKNFAVRPQEDMVRAILFPEKEVQPKFVWVKYEDTGYHQTSESYKHLGVHSNSDVERQTFLANIMQNTNLHHALEISHRFEFLTPSLGLTKNRCLFKATKQKMPHDWRGPILVHRMTEKGDKGKYQDMGMQDLRDTVDCFEAYGNENLREAWNGRGHNKISAVKIACKGELPSGTEKYTSVSIPLPHRILSNKTSQISELIGIPITAMKYPVDKTWSSWENVEATFLHLDCDPASNFWGFAPMYWQNNVGNVLVCREDGKELLPRQLEAICSFCQFEISPKFELLGESTDDSRRPEDTRQVFSEMTPAKFREYFKRYCEEMAVDDPTWRNVPSPYDAPERSPYFDDEYYEDGSSWFRRLAASHPSVINMDS